MYVSDMIGALIDLYTLVILGRAVFSWLPPESRRNDFYAFLLRITEPVLAPVRRLFPPGSRVDFSPLVVILLLQFISRALR